MDILKISILGITAVLLALILKSYRPEYSYYISIAVCICIFMFVGTKLEQMIGYAEKMQQMIQLDDSYMAMILKMIGITYVAEFAANMCKDCGYQTIAGQIELFAKLSILVLGMPVILAFMETIGELFMKRLLGIALFLLVLLYEAPVWGAGTEDLMGEMDFSEISSFLEDKEEMPVTFEELVEAMLKGGEIPYETVGDYVKALLWSGFDANRQLVLKLLAVSLAFSILKNYAGSFFGSYISEICFYLCYCFMMALLLKSFSVMNETVLKTTGDMVTFMKALIPTYCMAISFTLNLNSSAAVYSLIFTAVYLVEWLIRYLLVPLVQVYIMLEFLNHLMEEERFGRLTELIADGVRFLLKAAVSFILGINIIQGMIAPAMDRLTGNTIARTIQMVPGLGNVVNGTGQILISSGMVIKNCVGAAALLILAILCIVPYLNMAVLAVLYKFLSAVLEPVADKRLSGGMNGIANGGMLYLKILSTCLMMFFLTIALSSAACGLGAGG